jgi:hypothetical protein
MQGVSKNKLDQTARELAAQFYRRLSSENGTDINLDAVIRENKRPHQGVDLDQQAAGLPRGT